MASAPLSVAGILRGASAIAAEAAAMLARMQPGPRATQRKERHDVVTDADLAAEAVVLDGIRRLTPGAAILSEKALGRSATVFVAVTLEDQRRETMAKFERAVALCREVQDCHLMTGESDYLLRIVIADNDRYERIHQETLSKLPGVRRLVSNFTIRTVFRRAASVAR